MVSNEVKDLLGKIFYWDDIGKNPDEYLIAALIALNNIQKKTLVTTQDELIKAVGQLEVKRYVSRIKWMKDGFDNTKGDNP